MEFLAFFGGVWAAIALGIFVIAMIVGCTYDRHYVESPKWYIFFIGLAVIIAVNFPVLRDTGFSGLWSSIIHSPFWKYAGFYILIGFGYCIIEFFLEVRRSARFWSRTWDSYKKNNLKNVRDEVVRQDERRRKNEAKYVGDVAAEDSLGYDTSHIDRAVTEEMVTGFIRSYGRDWTWSKRIIVVEEKTDEDGVKVGIEPKVNRPQLAASIGCWTVWWPFYAISLIIGDLCTEFFRFIADCVAHMSGRFVKLAFKDVFKM